MRKLAFAVLIVVGSALASGCHVGFHGHHGHHGHHRYHHGSIDRTGDVPAIADGVEAGVDQGSS